MVVVVAINSASPCELCSLSLSGLWSAASYSLALASLWSLLFRRPSEFFSGFGLGDLLPGRLG